MTELSLYQVDAFATQVFEGNPAAVIVLDRFLDDSVMQSIGAENNLAETAFCVLREDGEYDLRWFTPSVEIDFCGHATIATAHVLKEALNLSDPFVFHAKIGRLRVRVDDPDYVLEAPIAEAKEVELSVAMRQAFPMPLSAAFEAGPNLYVVAETVADIVNFKPDFSAILPLSNHGVGLTAAGQGDYDFTSRFFVPAEGIDEDAVTGSAHAALGPYWGNILGKRKMLARQASPRGGDLKVSVKADRVEIAGPAVTYLRGTILI
ncbi:PhzF family phenazine biosynthesis protein [Litorimonas sp. WD9-15]|uniref:PhzF family phenazine biosynthesis protein n=1 Tax=Litorimonas sp. WD9-15 TaxID=3418716 RepID=UPI003D06C3EA